MSQPLTRSPDAQSPYWIERRADGFFAIHSEREGLVLDEIETAGDARAHVLDLIHADVEQAAAEAREAADDAARDTVCAQIAADLEALIAETIAGPALSRKAA